MFKTDYTKLADGASSKVAMMKRDPLGYFVLSMLAGAFIGTGVLLAFTCGGLLTGLPYVRIVMGCTFGVALSLVVMGGAELFTGNNMAMTMGMFEKKVSGADTVKLWVFCWFGNLVGALILAVLYHLTGLGSATESVGEFMAAGAAAKMSAGPVALLTRGILCNFLVCMAVWSASRASSDAGKLIMIFWCLLAFITTGFEHSIANMTLMAVALMDPFGQAVSLGGYVYNLLIVTVGNIIGGAVFVAFPYYLASRRDKA